MTTDGLNVLKRIEGLPAPRHLFVLPNWAQLGVLDRLLEDGYVTCTHSQRDRNGALQVAMHLSLTARAERLLHPPPPTWREKLFKASAAGACLIAFSLLILYLG